MLFQIFTAVCYLFGASYAINCPDAQVIAPCTCNSINQEVLCSGSSVTHQTLTNLMSNLNKLNPNGGIIQNLKVSQTNIMQLNTTIFGSNITYQSFDFSQNSNLQSLHDKLLGSDWNKLRIKAVNVSFSNCSLSWDRDGFMTDALNRFLDPEIVKLDHNNINGLKESDRYYGPKTLEFNSNLVLDLSHNYITDIGYQWFIRSPNARVIDLSFNRIKNIWNEAFKQNNPSPKYVDQYMTINLANNKLSEASRFYNTIFESLKRPTKLLLESNLFSYLPSTTFYAFLKGDHKNQINVGNNLLICNSNSKWLQDFKTDFQNRVFNYNCSNHQNQSIFDFVIAPGC